MKTCPTCGKEVMENFDACFHCGQSLSRKEYSLFNQEKVEVFSQKSIVYILLVFVSILFPLLGIFLSIVMAKELKGFSKILLFLGIMMFVFRVIGLAIFVIVMGM